MKICRVAIVLCLGGALASPAVASFQAESIRFAEGDSSHVVIVSSRTVSLLSSATEKPVWSQTFPEDAALSGPLEAFLTREGRFLLLVTKNGFSLFALPAFRPVLQAAVSIEYPRFDVSVSPDGQWVSAIRAQSGWPLLYHLPNTSPVSPPGEAENIARHRGNVTGISFSRDGRWMLLQGPMALLSLTPPYTLKTLGEDGFQTGEPYFLGDKNWVVYQDQDCHVWDPDAKQALSLPICERAALHYPVAERSYPSSDRTMVLEWMRPYELKDHTYLFGRNLSGGDGHRYRLRNTLTNQIVFDIPDSDHWEMAEYGITLEGACILDATGKIYKIYRGDTQPNRVASIGWRMKIVRDRSADWFGGSFKKLVRPASLSEDCRFVIYDEGGRFAIQSF